MAYRRTARKARSSNRRVSRSSSRSVRRSRTATRRVSGARRGTNTLRIVVEQPPANPIQRPIDLAASQAAHAPILANGKAKF